MLSRALLTAASLTVAAAAALLLDCSASSVQILGGDPVDVCGTAASMGLTGDTWIAIGLFVVAILSLTLTWIPSLRPGEKRRRLSPTKTLERNLSRIPEVGGEEHRSDEPTPSRSRLASVRRRLEAVEASFGSELASRETVQQWMDLLREANDLHNSGDLSTEDFREINTRLLDLHAEPGRVVGVHH